MIVSSDTHNPDHGEDAAPLIVSPDPGSPRAPAATVTGQRRRRTTRRLGGTVLVGVAALALAIGVAAPALADTGYVLERQWGSAGTGDGQFGGIIGVATDASGNVYVADSGNHRIQKFSSTGSFIAKWGSCTCGDLDGNGKFGSLGGVATDNSGNVYVTDTPDYTGGGDDRIQKFSSSGSFIAKWGSHGTGDGQFWGPGGVATDAAGNVYVADLSNARIQKFSSSGNFITKWGSYGSGDGQFYWVRGVATDAAGNVYVADGHDPVYPAYRPDRIQKFSPSGSFITKWSVAADVFDVATDSSGAVYATQSGQIGDEVFSSIQKFSGSGSYITDWTIWRNGCGQEPWWCSAFRVADSIATDRFGSVYVADTLNSRIQKFTPTQNPEQPPPDSDGDGVADADDNCVNAPNPGQADSDADGAGDACDAPADRDGDGMPDDHDACPDLPGTGADGCPPPPPSSPTAEFAISPSPSQAGQAVTFDWTGTCPAAPCTFTWVDEGPDGDGGLSSPLGSGDPRPVTFSAAGTKYIELTVTDGLDRSAVSPIHQHQVTAELRWSTDTDRAPSQPLDGATLPSSAVCVVLDNEPAKQGPVRFYLDEPPDATPLRTDTSQPWDLAGGSIASCTRRRFTAGTHTVTAVEADGDRHTATFTRR
jgi:NHL repeat/Thrombospondin type 3 repeat